MKIRPQIKKVGAEGKQNNGNNVTEDITEEEDKTGDGSDFLTWSTVKKEMVYCD